jgi:hypothetical protein
VAPIIERIDSGRTSNPMRVLIRLTAPYFGLMRQGPFYGSLQKNILYASGVVRDYPVDAHFCHAYDIAH